MLEFWSFVDVKELDECWLWLGRTTRKGYGRCSTKFGSLSPHRVAFELWHDVPLGSLHALHKCDNPPCCNPNHIFPGTASDNTKDMWGKGRGRSGMAGRRHSDAALLKMSEAHKANAYAGPKNHMFGNGARVSGMRNPFFGRKHSEETKAKMRASRAEYLATKKGS